MKFRLDPFPEFTAVVLNSLFNARILIFSVVIAKITLDRLYKYAMVNKKVSIIFDCFHSPCDSVGDQSFRL